MTLVERDQKFRERLGAAYQAGDLGLADFVICATLRDTAATLSTRNGAFALLFGLELWAAVFGRPHHSIAHRPIDWFMQPRQRLAATSAQAVTALFWLSQSPFGAEFAEDTLQLRPRLFTIAQEHRAEESKATSQAPAA